MRLLVLSRRYFPSSPLVPSRPWGPLSQPLHWHRLRLRHQMLPTRPSVLSHRLHLRHQMRLSVQSVRWHR